VIPPDELRHLREGPRVGERPGGAGTVTVTVSCHGDSAVVIDRARAVMTAVVDRAGPPWPSVDEWLELLPEWFVAACGPERSVEEVERWLRWWRSLPRVEQARVTREQQWTLADWLFWLEPGERQWFWWAATVEDPDTASVVVEVAGWPAPLGALEWLLRASGAVAVLHDTAVTA
jgi:hypothetical protein